MSKFKTLGKFFKRTKVNTKSAYQSAKAATVQAVQDLKEGYNEEPDVDAVIVENKK